MYMCGIFSCRAQLERAKQAKEDAEREKKALADRLQKYEQDTKRAEEGTCTCIYIYTLFVHLR